MRNANNNNGKALKEKNNSFDLWNFQAPKQFEKIPNEIDADEERGEIRQVQSYASSRYKPQLSMPSRPKLNNNSNYNYNIKHNHNKTQDNINQESKREITKRPQVKQSSLPKKKIGNMSIGIINYNPDSMVKYIKNKFKESNGQQQQQQQQQQLFNKENSSRGNVKKSSKETEAIGTSLYQKKIFSNDYEMQKQIKKAADEEKSKAELSQCTFKPKLCSNLPYDKSKMKIEKDKEKDIKKKNVYETQSKWLEGINSKNEKNYERKMNNELKHCSFVPKTTKMPNFTSGNIKYENETNELYYNRIKNARKATQKKQDGVNYAKNYDNRKKKNVKTLSSYYNNNDNASNANVNNVNNNNCFDQNIPLLQQEDTEFEKKKSMLMQDFHCWNFDNTEADDDFF